MLKISTYHSKLTNFYAAFPPEAAVWKGKSSGSLVLAVHPERTSPWPYTMGRKVKGKIPAVCSPLVRGKFSSYLANHLREHCHGNSVVMNNHCLAFAFPRAAESPARAAVRAALAHA